MPELDYNQLFLDNVLVKNKVLTNYVKGNQTLVRIDKAYVETVIARV